MWSQTCYIRLTSGRPIFTTYAFIISLHRKIDSMSHSNSATNTGRGTGTQPAPPDKAQAEAIKNNSQSVGTVQTQKGEDIILRDYVYSTLWKQVKFILRDDELDLESKMAKQVMRDLNVAMDETIRKEYWARNRGKVLKLINQKRNNTIGSIKKEFISKYWCTSICLIHLE
jgi:hypothetical protein